MDKKEISRFITKIFRDKHTGCWIWLAGKARGGYGTFWYNNKLNVSHRVSYEHWIGKIPYGLELDHLCRNTSCVNPWHLEPVTHKENNRRGLVNQHKHKTHCNKGHEFNEENTYNYDSRRYCRICKKEYLYNYYRAHKQ